MNEFQELLKIARETYANNPDEDLDLAITEHGSIYNDDLNTLMATAFYAGMLYQKTETENSISLPVGPEDAFQLMQSLIRNNEVKLTLYVEEKE